MLEKSLHTLKPEKWNNIPQVITDGVRTLTNECLRMDDQIREVTLNLEAFKSHNEVFLKKYSSEIKKTNEEMKNNMTKSTKNNELFVDQMKVQLRKDLELIINSNDNKNVSLMEKVQLLEE